jgi:hypothetical protein
MRFHFRVLPALVVVASLGCQHTREGTRPDAERLTQAQMLEGHFTNVYDAVAAMRSAWLFVRGTDSFGEPSRVWVYFDQTRLGGVEELRGVTVNSVAWARHYNGVDATMRWGVGHSAGVIQVSSYR